MRILVTGITGFAGSHLVEALLCDAQVQIVGLSRGTDKSSIDANERVDIRHCDIRDSVAMQELLQEIQPEQVYHLAGSSSVGQSFAEPLQVWQTNVEGTRSLYDAIHSWGGNPRILYVGSGLSYADPQSDEQGVTEETPFAPANPYALSKSTADLLSYQYYRWPGLQIIRARPFNHIGPRQSPRFALPSFAQQLAQMEKGLIPPILQTGNLDAIRDFTDVRDIVTGYTKLMNHGVPGEAYNLGSGKVISIRDVVNGLIQRTGKPVEVRQKDHLKRAAESRITRANITKIRQAVSWQPTIPLEQSLDDIMNYWRGQV